MRTVLPHNVFWIDFNEMLESGRKQEALHPVNLGEHVISQQLHSFFVQEVLPLISSDTWVFEAAATFATEFIDDYFVYLQLQGDEISSTQHRLSELRTETTEFLKRAYRDGLCPSTVNPSTLSDFMKIVNVEGLEIQCRAYANDLYERIVEFEKIHRRVSLRAHRNNYEVAFPRVFFVVRRALSVKWEARRKRASERLLQPSNYVDWFQQNAPSGHILRGTLFQNWDFYRVARNVASHHTGLKWDPEDNTVILQDASVTLSVPTETFSQRIRHFTYFCELGVRGILAAFAEVERGPTSNELVKRYLKTFPSEFKANEMVELCFYPVNA